MADIDYKAIADELRASHEAPRIDMLPGEYTVATAIEHLAHAIERAGGRPPAPFAAHGSPNVGYYADIAEAAIAEWESKMGTADVILRQAISFGIYTTLRLRGETR